MKIRYCNSNFILVAERKSRELNLQLIDSDIDSRVAYINDENEVIFYKACLGIQIPIDEMPLYRDTIVDIFNAVMGCRPKQKYYINEELKEELSKEWMTIYDLYKWQKLNHIDTFGYGRRTGEKNG